MLIDDSDGDAGFLRIGLDETGLSYELLEFATGEAALRHLSSCEVSPHLIITDAILPRTDFKLLLTRLKQATQRRPVTIIVLSGMMDPRIIQQALANGAKDYIVKSSSLEGWCAIGVRIQQWLEN